MKNQIPLSKAPTDKWLDWLSLAALAFTWIYLLIHYAGLPDTIPVHFNAKGEIDQYGDKTNLFILPVIITLAAIMVTVVAGLSSRSDHPRGIDTETFLQKQKRATRILRVVRLVFLVFTAGIMVFIIDASGKQGSSLPWWVLWVFIAGMLAPVMLGVST